MSKKIPNWTLKEIEFLKKHYPNNDKKILTNGLNRKFHTISCKASRLGIKRNIIYNISSENGMWKKNAKKNAIHIWVRARKIKPKFCEYCKKKKPYDLANISQEYHRDINDFEWLCRKCHMISDGRLKKLAEGNKNGFS